MPKGTLVGTIDYMAPEILNEMPAGPAADLWSLGVIIYMMISGGISPFVSNSYIQTNKNISEGIFTFEGDRFDDDTKDLIRKLLVVNP